MIKGKVPPLPPIEQMNWEELKCNSNVNAQTQIRLSWSAADQTIQAGRIIRKQQMSSIWHVLCAQRGSGLQSRPPEWNRRPEGRAPDHRDHQPATQPAKDPYLEWAEQSRVVNGCCLWKRVRPNIIQCPLKWDYSKTFSCSCYIAQFSVRFLSIWADLTILKFKLELIFKLTIR